MGQQSQSQPHPANTETYAIWALKNVGVALNSAIVAFVEQNNRTSFNKLNYNDVLYYIYKFGLAKAIEDLTHQSQQGPREP